MSPNYVVASIAVCGTWARWRPCGMPIKTDVSVRSYAWQRFDNWQPDFHEI